MVALLCLMDIIKFLVNSPKGSVFVKSDDALDVVKNVEQFFITLDYMIKEIREKCCSSRVYSYLVN